MQEIIVDFIENYGYLAIAVLICVENVFPPIPSEVVLLFAGFMTTRSNLTVPFVIVFATVGSLIGAYILYMLGYALQGERLKKLVSGKLGKITGLKVQDIDKAEIWFEKYEKKAVLFCRCVPILRSMISVPAGMAKMKPLPFGALTLLGSVVWNTIIVIMGAVIGEAWEDYLIYFNDFSKIVLVILLIGGGAFVGLYIKSRRKNKKNKEE